MVSLNFQGDLIKPNEIGNIMKVTSTSTKPTKTNTSAKSKTGAKTKTMAQSRAAFTDEMNRQVKEVHA
jgi:hypothetical protein